MTDKSHYELKIEYLPIDALKPYDKNARKHADADVETIVASIKEFGFDDPIGIWGKDNTIVEGHGRLLAAKKLGMESVPVIRLDHLTDEQRRAYALAHNKTAEMSEWDIDVLGDEIADIFDIDMAQFGFDSHLIDEELDVEEDELPENVQKRCKLGDVWKLGDHRLICGDTTDETVVEKLMGEMTAKLLFTSPPYSDMRTYNGSKDLSVNKIVGFISAYNRYANILCVNLGIQRKNAEIVQYWDEYIDAARQEGLKLLAWNVWDKMQAGSVGQQSAMIPIRHEWIFVFGKKPVDLNLTWEKRKSSIYSDGRKRRVRQKDGTFRLSSKGVTSNAFKKMESLVKLPDKMSLDSVTEQLPELGKVRKKHPATFPVHLPAEYIIAFTDVEDVVIEPFAGSGTTCIACEQLKRKCYMCELDEHYCDVIIQRWEDYTGSKAVLLNE